MVITGTTQLIRAAMLNNLPRVLQLIDIGAPLELADTSPMHRFSALIWASDLGHEHVVAALLDGGGRGGAVIDQRGSSGITPLMNASHAGREGVVRLLLTRGAAQELQAGCGFAALHDAVDRNHDGVVALLCAAPGAAAALLLRDADEGNAPLAIACVQSHARSTAALLSADAAGATLELLNLGGDSPLMLASQWGHEDSVRLLLARCSAPRRAHPPRLRCATATARRRSASPCLAAAVLPRARRCCARTARRSEALPPQLQ
jgi:ankyrin repeat protein